MTKASLKQSDALFWDYTNALFCAIAFFSRAWYRLAFSLLITCDFVIRDRFVTHFYYTNSHPKQTRIEIERPWDFFHVKCLLFSQDIIRICDWGSSLFWTFSLSLFLSLSRFLVGLETIKLETLIQSFEIGKNADFTIAQFFNYSASPCGHTHHTSNFNCCAQ